MVTPFRSRGYSQAMCLRQERLPLPKTLRRTPSKYTVNVLPSSLSLTCPPFYLSPRFTADGPVRTPADDAFAVRSERHATDGVRVLRRAGCLTQHHFAFVTVSPPAVAAQHNRMACLLAAAYRTCVGRRTARRSVCHHTAARRCRSCDESPRFAIGPCEWWQFATTRQWQIGDTKPSLRSLGFGSFAPF